MRHGVQLLLQLYKEIRTIFTIQLKNIQIKTDKKYGKDTNEKQKTILKKE